MPKAVTTMRCADEFDWPERTFTEEGDGDFSCDECGWLQRSFGGGLKELCERAVWSSTESYNLYRDQARSEGETVPDQPPRLERL